MPPTHRYHDTVAMIVHHSHLYQLLGRTVLLSNATALLDVATEGHREDPNDQSMQSIALTFMPDLLSKTISSGSFAWGNPQTKNGSIYASIAYWAWKLKRNDIYQKAVQECVKCSDVSPLLQVISNQVRKHRRLEIKHEHWDVWLSGLLSSGDLTFMDTLTKAWTSSAGNEKILASFSSCQAKLLPQQLNSKQSFGPQDSRFLMTLLEKHTGDSGSEEIRQCLINGLVECGDKHLLYLVLGVLLHPNADNTTHGSSNKDLGHSILQKTVSRLHLDISGLMPQARQMVDWNISTSFLDLVDCCFKQGFGPIASGLLEKSFQEILAKRDRWPAPSGAMMVSMQQFLDRLCSLFQNNQLSFSSALSLWTALLRRYVMQAVPSPPQKLNGWARKERGCHSYSCMDCPALNAFLRSETQQVFKLQEAQKRRTDIERRLDIQYYGWTTKYPQSGNVHILTVMKREGGNLEYAREFHDYQRRLQEARTRLQPLQKDYVQ